MLPLLRSAWAFFCSNDVGDDCGRCIPLMVVLWVGAWGVAGLKELGPAPHSACLGKRGTVSAGHQ